MWSPYEVAQAPAQLLVEQVLQERPVLAFEAPAQLLVEGFLLIQNSGFRKARWC